MAKVNGNNSDGHPEPDGEIHMLFEQHEQTISIIDEGFEMTLKDHKQVMPLLGKQFETTFACCENKVGYCKGTMNRMKELKDDVMKQKSEDMNDDVTTNKMDVLALLKSEGMNDDVTTDEMDIFALLKIMTGFKGDDDHPIPTPSGG